MYYLAQQTLSINTEFLFQIAIVKIGAGKPPDSSKGVKEINTDCFILYCKGL